jgi:ABC-type lipoprotein release transport system permease subunit
VIASFDAGFDQYDSKLVYTDLYEAQAFGDGGDTVTGIELKVREIDNAREIARQLALLRRLVDSDRHHPVGLHADLGEQAEAPRRA